MAVKAWRARVVALATNSMTYVLGFAVGGAALCVAGVGVLVGVGYALLTAGAFLLAGSWYITQGLKTNG